jgi:CBS domain containing-hemolysin-like protein
MTNYLWLVFFALLSSAFFSAAEMAFISANRLRIELEKNQGKWTATVLVWLKKYNDLYMTTMLVGNNLTLVVYGIYTGKIIRHFLFPSLGVQDMQFLPLAIQTIISTGVILITAEFLPKLIAQIAPDGFLRWFLPLILFFIAVLFPITIGVRWLSKLFLGWIGKSEVVRPKHFTRSDLNAYIQDITTRAENNPEQLDHEIHILKNALDFSHAKARDCMIQRTDFVAVELNERVEKLSAAFIETGFSKILVYKTHFDDVVGYVHALQMFKKPKHIGQVIRPVFFVPETMKATEVMQLFLQKKRSIAIVVDEFGGTSGMLTMEDIIEEIFGEIDDEYDDTEELKAIMHDENTWELSAKHAIAHINEKFDLNLPEKESYETLAGLIIESIARIPGLYEEVKIDHYIFKILAVNKHKIETVLITRQ